MQHVRFGRTGLQVSRLCLGTMTFGLQCDEPASFAILDAAAEAGFNFLDTADVYPLGGTLDNVGRTEEIVGKWLRGKRARGPTRRDAIPYLQAVSTARRARMMPVADSRTDGG